MSQLKQEDVKLPNLEMKVTGVFGGDELKRQTSETTQLLLYYKQRWFAYSQNYFSVNVLVDVLTELSENQACKKCKFYPILFIPQNVNFCDDYKHFQAMNVST